MIRTQIYLTEAEQKALRALARRSGRTQSDLIREAVDSFISRSQKVDRRSMLEQGRGIWKDRDTLPDFAALRGEMNRSGGASG